MFSIRKEVRTNQLFAPVAELTVILLVPNTVPTAIRTVNGNGPVTDVTSSYMACGNQAKVVSFEAPVDAGSVVEIRWSSTVSCTRSDERQ